VGREGIGWWGSELSEGCGGAEEGVKRAEHDGNERES
jgi:hypothetical protein